jgi:hypothetical protein
MAVNFNLLNQAGPGPANFYEGLMQGQEQQRVNALAQQKMAQEQELNALRMQQTRGAISQQERQVKAQTAAQKTAMFRERLLRAPDPNSVRELVKMQYADPDLGPILSQTGTLEQALKEVPDDPVQFERHRQQEALGMSEWMKSQLPKTVGNAIYKPDTGTFVTPPERAPAPPASAAEYALAQKDPNFMRFLQERAAATRPPRPEAAPRTQQVTMSDGSLGIVNMDTGAITPATMGGAPVKGKPSAFAEKATAQKAQLSKDLGFAITQLGDITKEGGLIDQSTGSGIGRGVDIGARIVGKAMPGDIAIGKIAPIADLVLKMVPRFEGPQSNKDTQSYKEAAGQLADPTLPTKIRKEAGKTVLRLMQERKDQFVTSDMATEGAPAAGTGGFKYLGKEGG